MRKTLLASLVVVGAAVLVVAALVLRPAHPPARSTPVAITPATAVPPRPGPSAAAAGALVTPVKRTPRASPVVRQAAPVWTLDKAASRLAFRATMNGTPFDGVFRDWDAEIAFDPRNLAGSRATITVETTSALTGQPIKDAALPNSEWLATAAYPKATLVTRSISQTGPGRFLANADVHIRGVLWRTTVPFTVNISHDSGRMDATMTLDRRTFGIGEGPFRSPAPVEPSVQVSMKLLAKKTK